MVDLVVRPARLDDSDDLCRLMTDYIVDFYRHPRPSDERLRALVHTLLEGAEGIQFVAAHADALVGFATLYFTYSTLRAQKVTIMNDLYVKEDFRGTGVAAALFKGCHAFTRENDYAYMTWETAEDNLRAQRFYEKMGARRSGWITYSI